MLQGIESDQGYQNYLFYNGHFNTALGNATLFHQGTGVVNTIGAMNGYRWVGGRDSCRRSYFTLRTSPLPVV